MLVDHLTHRIFQQNHKLIEGLNFSLQLYAVNEKDRYGHTFTPQRIKIEVLQAVTLGHVILHSFFLLAFLLTRLVRQDMFVGI